ncbi:hypothetical protein M3J09_002516 [Ascochyta lentis]
MPRSPTESRTLVAHLPRSVPASLAPFQRSAPSPAAATSSPSLYTTASPYRTGHTPASSYRRLPIAYQTPPPSFEAARPG